MSMIVGHIGPHQRRRQCGRPAGPPAGEPARPKVRLYYRKEGCKAQRHAAYVRRPGGSWACIGTAYSDGDAWRLILAWPVLAVDVLVLPEAAGDPNATGGRMVA